MEILRKFWLAIKALMEPPQAEPQPEKKPEVPIKIDKAIRGFRDIYTTDLKNCHAPHSVSVTAEEVEQAVLQTARAIREQFKDPDCRSVTITFTRHVYGRAGTLLLVIDFEEVDGQIVPVLAESQKDHIKALLKATSAYLN